MPTPNTDWVNVQEALLPSKRVLGLDTSGTVLYEAQVRVRTDEGVSEFSESSVPVAISQDDEGNITLRMPIGDSGADVVIDAATGGYHLEDANGVVMDNTVALDGGNTLELDEDGRATVVDAQGQASSKPSPIKEGVPKLLNLPPLIKPSGLPPVSRLGDDCTGHGTFPPRRSVAGSGDVFVNHIPAHRQSDGWASHCNVVPVCHGSNLAAGSSTVFANKLQLSRIGDPVACGSSVASGSPNIYAGG